MPLSQYSGQIAVAANGYAVNLPPSPTPLTSSVSVTANPNNSADVFVGGCGQVRTWINPAGASVPRTDPTPGVRLPPGKSALIATDDPTTLWLSAMPSDGISFGAQMGVSP